MKKKATKKRKAKQKSNLSFGWLLLLLLLLHLLLLLVISTVVVALVIFAVVASAVVVVVDDVVFVVVVAVVARRGKTTAKHWSSTWGFSRTLRRNSYNSHYWPTWASCTLSWRPMVIGSRVYPCLSHFLPLAEFLTIFILQFIFCSEPTGTKQVRIKPRTFWLWADNVNHYITNTAVKMGTVQLVRSIMFRWLDETDNTLIIRKIMLRSALSVNLLRSADFLQVQIQVHKQSCWLALFLKWIWTFDLTDQVLKWGN